jgi:hAT family C-terminal dimerisation region
VTSAEIVDMLDDEDCRSHHVRDVLRKMYYKCPVNKWNVKKLPLDWWKDNQENYPAVWAVEERYLAIPATSAPSERAFSAAGNTVTAKRCRLAPDTVRDIFF